MRRTRFFSALTAIVLLAALGACRQGAEVHSPAGENAPIDTDRIRYTLELGEAYARFSMRATYVNHTDTPVYIETCGTSSPFYGFEKRIGETWVPVQAFASPGCTSELITHEVLSGERFKPPFDPIVLDPGPDLAGTYRMLWAGVKSLPGEVVPLLPKNRRVSNAFVLEAP